MAEKEAFYCTISFLLFAAIRSFLTNLPYYFSVVHAFQSSALHLYSFHCFDFLGVQCKYPKAVSMWKESYEIWEQFSALEPQSYIFTNFLL